MSRVVIDARESGTSTGRYIDKLVENLHELKPHHEIILLTKEHRVAFYKKIAPQFQVIETPFKEFSFGEQIGLKKQIESLHPDLVHFGIVQQPIFYRGRVVTTMHDLTTIRFRNPSKNVIIFTVKQQVYRWVNKRAAQKSRIVLAPTEFAKKDIVDFTGINSKKVVVTYEAADHIPDEPKAINELVGKKFIMYIGRPMPHKNLERLIDAFAIIQEKVPDLHLVLAGKKDALYEAHARYAASKGIKNIVFTGFITDAELRWLYENTLCYVFPSLSEGFGLPGLEAMIHGAPVASSNATCLPEVYGNAPDYFDPTSSRGMADAILNIITNKSHSNELKTRGKKQAQQYSWKRMAQQTLDVYNDVLS